MLIAFSNPQTSAQISGYVLCSLIFIRSKLTAKDLTHVSELSG
jgi:hypothetical protein